MIIERYLTAAAGFENTLRTVGADQWTAPTPCTEWNVRQLVNHVVKGNHLNRLMLVEPDAVAQYRRDRDVDMLGDDPLAVFTDSVDRCAEAFREHPDARLAYPMGVITTDRALAIRTGDVLVHTWDLARAVGADETLDPGLVDWARQHLPEALAGLADLPGVFAPPTGQASTTSGQDALLRRLGRTP